MNATDDQVKAGIMIVKAVADAIRELGSVPSGHLYTQLMGHMDLAQYERIIHILKNAKLVEEKHHELFWIA